MKPAFAGKGSSPVRRTVTAEAVGRGTKILRPVRPSFLHGQRPPSPSPPPPPWTPRPGTRLVEVSVLTCSSRLTTKRTAAQHRLGASVGRKAEPTAYVNRDFPDER